MGYNMINKECYAGIQFIQTMFVKAKGERSPRVLDWSSIIGYYEEEHPEDLYQDYIEHYKNMPMRIDYLGESEYKYIDEYTEITSRKFSDLDKKYYDYIIIREILNDDTLLDTIRKANEYLRDDGYLYVDLIDNWIIDKVIVSASSVGLYPISITNLYADYENVANEFYNVGLNYSYYEDNKKIYDMLGYTSITFCKNRATDIFVWLFDFEKEHKENNLASIFDGYYHEAELVIYLTIQAIYFRSIRAPWEKNNCYEDGMFIKYEELTEFLNKIKYMYNGLQKIFFGDYFDIDIPRHLKYKELEPQKYYYLSPTEFMHIQFDNYLNEKQIDNELPEIEVRKLIIQQLEEHYMAIDIYGNERPDIKDKIYSFDTMEQPSTELHSYNDSKLDNLIDIESTIVYNLLRIKPKGDISINYLKYYFYVTEYLKEYYNYFKHDLKGKKYEFRYEYNKFSDGFKTIQNLTNKYSLFKAERYFRTHDHEYLRNSYILIDPIETHQEIIEKFRKELIEKQNEKYLEKLALRFSKNTIFESINKLEENASKQYGKDKTISFTGVIESLVDGEKELDRFIKDDIKSASISKFSLALEIYLRLRIANCERKRELELGKYNISDLSNFSMGDLYHIYKNYFNYSILYKKKYSSINNPKIKGITELLYKHKEIRNEQAHSYINYPLKKAMKLADEICMLIVQLDRVMMSL